MLPTNLQGIWAEEYSTPWRGDFHSNINLQMNYWPAEVTNLADCHVPLMRFLAGMAKEGAKTAKAYYNAPGWMAYHTQNPWFETAPSFLPASVRPTCGAWLAQHLWTHYQFTQDREFLREFYPLLRGAAEVLRGVLVEDPKTGDLVTVPSSSPENSYAFKDPAGTQGDVVSAWAPLRHADHPRPVRNHRRGGGIPGIDEDFARRLDGAARAAGADQAQRDGRIMEWQEDFEEVETDHRHVRTCGDSIQALKSARTRRSCWQGAQVARPPRRCLDRLVHGVEGEFLGAAPRWRPRRQTALHADRARCGPNLMCLHPPFQIDGNFGGCAAVAEMLVQSQERTPAGEVVIHLLPALPSAWATGRVTGLRARGGFTVDITWQDGQVTAYRIASARSREATVRLNGETKTIQSEKRQAI